LTRLYSGHVSLNSRKSDVGVSGIYVIRNNNNNKVYVGSAKHFLNRRAKHWRQLKLGTHGNVKLTRSVRKHGIENFTFEVLEFLPYEKVTIIDRENFWIQRLDSKKSGYNIADASFGDTLTNNPNRVEIIAKRTKTLKLNNSKLTKSELKEKHGRLGKLNGRYIDGMNGFKICTICNKTTIQKASKVCLNCSDRTGVRNSFFGKKHTEETKQKISSANLGKIPPNRVKIKVRNTIYKSATEASKYSKCTVMTVLNRARSDKFKDYNFV